MCTPAPDEQFHTVLQEGRRLPPDQAKSAFRHFWRGVCGQAPATLSGSASQPSLHGGTSQVSLMIAGQKLTPQEAAKKGADSHESAWRAWVP
ncbi:hypothetical protein GCM10010344_24350 [Streptomyces bluensis]|nr:hypothetical protein GCM10010344_24350 [Streptomyces bluensis]